MISRRNFSTCAICALAGFAASNAEAQAQAPTGIKRTVLQKTDFPDKYSSVLVLIELEPNFNVERHTHPGVESTYVVEGGIELTIQGQAPKAYKPGEGFQVPPSAPHSARNGDKPTKLIATFIVERDKPLASPAPA